MKRPGYRGGGKGQDLNLTAQPLQLLLVDDSESLLLVYDDQAQVPEADIGGQQPMGPYQDIELPLAGFFYSLLLL